MNQHFVWEKKGLFMKANRVRRILGVGLPVLGIALAAFLLFGPTRLFQKWFGANSVISNQPVYSFDDPQWWDHAVFYEIFVRSFSDSNGDGIGDFNGITQKLDYLNDGDPDTTTDLGITAIWLMPIFPSPSYHGYDVTDYLTVNPDYGTLDDLKNLIAEAHIRGIHVIIDFVINHTSDENPWFVSAQDSQSEYHDWYIWSQTDPGYKGPWGEDVWHKAANGLYYYGVFTSDMPDLNYTNPAVTAEIQSVAKYWLTEMNVDGFRIDGARHLIEEGKTQANTQQTIQWFQQFLTYYKGIKPTAMSVGEVWDSTYQTIKYTQADSFDMDFDFNLASILIDQVKQAKGNSLASQINSEWKLYQGKGMATFLSNHDMDRVMSQLAGNVAQAKLAAFALLTAPGTPFVYYGEEIGAEGQKPDEKIRTPMQWSASENAGFSTVSPWEPLDASYSTANVATETEDPYSLLNLYRSLINIRLRNPALVDGSYLPLTANPASVYSAIRQSEDQTILLIANLSDQPAAEVKFSSASMPLQGEYRLIPLFGAALQDSITIAPAGSGGSFTLTAEIPAESSSLFILESVH